VIQVGPAYSGPDSAADSTADSTSADRRVVDSRHNERFGSILARRCRSAKEKVAGLSPEFCERLTDGHGFLWPEKQQDDDDG